MNKIDKTFMTVAIVLVAVSESIHLAICFFHDLFNLNDLFSYPEFFWVLGVQALIWFAMCLIFLPIDISMIGIIYFVRNMVQNKNSTKVAKILNIGIGSFSLINVLCYIVYAIFYKSNAYVIEKLIVFPTYSSIIVLILIICDLIYRKKTLIKKSNNAQ